MSGSRKRKIDIKVYLENISKHRRRSCRKKADLFWREVYHGLNENADETEIKNFILAECKDLSVSQIISSAAYHGDCGVFLFCKYIFSQEFSTLVKGEDGNKWLSRACEGGQSIVSWLLKAGANPNCNKTESRPPDYRQPLVVCQSVEICNLLISYGADVNKRKFGSLSPLEQAVAIKHADLVKCLIEHGAEYKQDTSLLNIAVKTDHEMLKLVLSFYGTLENVPHKEISPLCIAVYKQDFESVKLLIEKGIDVDFKTTNFVCEYQSPALLNAVINRDNDVASSLLKHRPYVNRQRRNNKSALTLAVSKGDMEFTSYLLEHGANVKFKGTVEKTALTIAVSKGDMEFTRYLLEHGANVNLKGPDEKTALTIAVNLGKNNMMSLLIDMGAEVEGNILEVAVNAKNMIALRKLISIFKNKGIQVEVESVIQAEENNNLEAFRLLVESGLEFSEKQNKLLPWLLTGICQHSQNQRYLEVYLKKKFYKKEFIKLLLKNKYKFVSEETNCAIHNCIALRELALMSDLIYHGGFSPRILSLKSSEFCDVRDDLEGKLRGVFSPFCMALLCGCISIARDMLKASYLTISDLTRLPRNKQMNQILTDKNVSEGVDLLDEMSTTIPSLFQLSFIHVSDSLGNGPDRSDKINHLGIPPSLERALNFSCDYQIIGKEFLLSTSPDALGETESRVQVRAYSNGQSILSSNDFIADEELHKGLSLYKIIYLPSWYVDEICDPVQYFRRHGGKDRYTKNRLQIQYARMNALTKQFYNQSCASKDTEVRSGSDEEDDDSDEGDEEDDDSDEGDEEDDDSEEGDDVSDEEDDDSDQEDDVSDTSYDIYDSSSNDYNWV